MQGGAGDCAGSVKNGEGGRPTQVSVLYTNPSPTIIPYLIRLTTVLCVYMPHVKYAAFISKAPLMLK